MLTLSWKPSHFEMNPRALNTRKHVSNQTDDEFDPASEWRTMKGELVCRSTLQKLEAETSPQALTRLLGIFRMEVHKRAGIIHEACSSRDAERLQVCVHALKSSAQSFGCIPLATACMQLETLCGHENPERIFEARDALLALIDNTLAALDIFEREREHGR